MVDSKSIFDTWRKEYPELSYSQHQEYASWLYENYPNQSYFGNVFQEQVMNLSESIQREKEKPIRAIELGGWNGELAAAVLKRGSDIEVWDNFEICPIVPSVCSDDRYHHVNNVDDFIWNLSRLFEYDLFVASHALEHITTDDLRKLFHTVGHIPYLAFQIPFPLKGSWEGEICFHILELSPSEFVEFVESFGYKLEHDDKLPSNKGVVPEEHRFFFRKVLNED